ncbi:MAG: EAL domain-containing protein [Ilumatobacteraceae bacterium]
MQERGSWVADRTFVVAIGVNDAPLSGLPSLEFAHADAESVASEFCDSVRGVSSRANTQCLVTEETTTSAHVLQTLEAAARRCGPDDLLVIFFAGHGVVDQWSKALCLVAADTVIDDRGHVDPASALEVPSLISRVLTPCRGTTLLLLDTCFSGGFDVHDAEQRKLWRTTEMMFDTHLGPVERQYAILSCKADSVSREDPSLGHGLFTHQLLRAMRGEAANKRGEVTALSAFAFIDEENELQPPVDTHSGVKSRIVISRPGPAAHHQIGATTSSERAAAAAWSIRSLSNPLDAAGPLIAEMVAACGAARAGLAVGDHGEAISKVIRDLVGARSVQPVHLHRTSRGRPASKPSNPALTIDRDPSGLLPALVDRLSSGGFRDADGFVARRDDGDAGLIAVPTKYRGTADFDVLLIDGLEPTSRWATDLGAGVIQRTYRHLQHTSADRFDERSLEAELLDHLRATYGRVPGSLYERRFSLFRDQVGRQSFCFQPIVHISGTVDQVYIDSWEALARDPDGSHPARRAPTGLFNAAELWGTRFLVELDSRLLDKALAAYREAKERAEPELARRPMRPISVNVYPESVCNDHYLESVASALHRHEVGGSLLVLEISEKRSFARPEHLDVSVSTNAYFSDRLTRFSRELPGVSFAIDDFGVGHASLDRLAQMRLAHVKVDREVLFHDRAVDELRLVSSITRELTRSANKVVVEGYDGHCELSLSDVLYGGHVEFVQGWLFPMERPVLTSLPEDLRHEVADSIGKASDYRRRAAAS